ncbi:hypothetical protein K439DRAFT_1397060 [Ramaria rubella]|nr:hypothetical protein K439DRAFT_1397060 [Ramaria rubella]
MPKSSKKKKDKNVDFAKAKLKLGKGKQTGNNTTDTSFKARSIAVPYQTIGQDKDASKPTTRRNLTLDELIFHLKHYNPTIRKDALCGLRELLDNHPELMETSLTPVIQACARVVGDEDAEVRKALLFFFAWILRLAPLNKIRPHAPLLILFITSAQTHIFPAIRIDAVRSLDLLLELTPEIVIQGWNETETTGARVLEGYLGLMNAGSNFWTGHTDDTPVSSTSSVTLSSNSKLVVLSSLACFLHSAISPFSSSLSSTKHESTTTTWYMASSFSSHSEFNFFCSLIHPHHSANSNGSIHEVEWCNFVSRPNSGAFIGTFDYAVDWVIDSCFSLSELGEIDQAVDNLTTTSAPASQPYSTSSRVARLAHTLHPILVSTWLDVASNVFGVGASRSEVDAQLAISVSRIAGCLYGTIFRDTDMPIDARTTAFNDITALLGYMAVYLPSISESGEIQSEEFSRDLSFAYCELTSLAVLASEFDAVKINSKNHATSQAKRNKALSIQIDQVGEYVVKALDGELRSASHPLGYSLTASAYTMLLPTVWSLLKYQDAAENATILSSCINHAIRTSSKSATKRPAIQFVGMLALLHSEHETPITVLKSDELGQFRDWFQQLPKVLWEVGIGDPPLSEIILRLLLRVTQRRVAIFDVTVRHVLSNTIILHVFQTGVSVRSRLIPYFATLHPDKGKILGPFTKFKKWPDLRKLALDVAAVLIRDAGPFEGEALKTAVASAVADTEDLQYWCTLPV